MKTCEECGAYEPWAATGFGWCHRHAPAPGEYPDQDPPDVWWPTVRATGWCCEPIPKDQVLREQVES